MRTYMRYINNRKKITEKKRNNKQPKAQQKQQQHSRPPCKTSSVLYFYSFTKQGRQELENPYLTRILVPN